MGLAQAVTFGGVKQCPRNLISTLAPAVVTQLYRRMCLVARQGEVAEEDCLVCFVD